jgi:phosphatidylserine/phosphatidylglycerophosphate/cardiolipin synthase-like enzyme
VVTAEERVKLGPVKALRPGVTNFASIYDVLHSARRELFFVSPYISPEFIAILEFLSMGVPIRGVVAETPISLEAASMLADRSQLALRCLARQSGMLHDKLIIVDRKVVWNSSANLTWRGIMKTLEVLHASIDGKTLRNGLHRFEDIWDRSVPLSTVLQQRS